MTMTEPGQDTPMGHTVTSTSLPPGPGAELSAEEEAATRRFLENVNKWREARQMGEVSHGQQARGVTCQQCPKLALRRDFSCYARKDC